MYIVIYIYIYIRIHVYIYIYTPRGSIGVASCSSSTTEPTGPRLLAVVCLPREDLGNGGLSGLLAPNDA